MTEEERALRECFQNKIIDLTDGEHMLVQVHFDPGLETFTLFQPNEDRSEDDCIVMTDAQALIFANLIISKQPQQ